MQPVVRGFARLGRLAAYSRQVAHRIGAGAEANLQLQDGQRGGVDLQADPIAIAIPATDFVAAIVDAQALRRDAQGRNMGRHGFAGLPFGHGSAAIVIGQSGARGGQRDDHGNR